MNRLDELISRFLDDDLTPEERLELRHAIEADSQGADELLACYQQHRLLAALFRPASAEVVEAILTAVCAEDGFADSVMRQARAAATENTLVNQPAKKCDDPATKSKPYQQTAARPSLNWFDRLFPRPRWAFAVATAALIGFLVWLYPPVNNQPTLTVATGTQVILERDGQSSSVQDALKLLPGDRLRISGSNGATIDYGKENTRVALNDHTELKALAWRKGKRFELRQGKLEATVARQRPFGAMVLLTAQAEARVLGTKFTLTATTNATRLEVTEGKVKLTRTSDEVAVKVPAGYYAVAADATKLAALPLTGSILREYWTNLPGDYYITFLTSRADYPDHPSGHEYLGRFEAPSHWGTNYGARLCGYLHPPKTGDYTFWITAGDGGELWLSPDDSPKNKRQIGYAKPSMPHEWANHRGQQSSPITLVAGRKYYIEALHKQGKKDDHLAVAWQGPGREREVIPGGFLSPYKVNQEEKQR